MMSVKRAAIGWTMRIEESVALVEVGKSKVAACVLLYSDAIDEYY
jgi:hypothetical protein